MIQRTNNSAIRRPARKRRSPLDDHFSALAQRLNLVGQQGTQAPLQTLGVTSWMHGTGVSTVAINLAIRSAIYSDGPVLLVDAHLERPAIGKMLRAKARPGIAEWMAGEAATADIIHPTSSENLSVILAGRSRHAELRFDVARWSSLIAELKSGFSLVICDLPIAHELSSGLALSSLLDGIVFVVDAQQGHRQEAVRAQRQLVASGARLLGAVLNKQ